ncbi:hypothetical protein XcvCFBP7113P_19050 [Xanthomonas citri pv. vignicola]|nr:hypothetical protein XcvCFBP7113P_19050 [Xanthomonas citri pv. vignicola]
MENMLSDVQNMGANHLTVDPKALERAIAALSAPLDAGSGGDTRRDRTPADYAIEHAGYLATAAQRLLDARNELDALVMRREEEDDVEDCDMHAAQDCVDEACTGVRSAIYEFEKRRDRALAARQPEGVGPVAWRHTSKCTRESRLEVYPINMDVAYNRENWECEPLYTAPPARAAVPVDGDKPNLLTWQLQNRLQHLVRAGRYLEDRVVETRGAKCMDDFDHELNQAEKLLATHTQPAAAKDVPELFVQWLEREMPAGTIIGKPAWWAPKLARALRSAERGVLGGCNG